MRLFGLKRLVLATLAIVMLLGGSASGFVPSNPAISFTTVGLATSAGDWDWNAVIDGKLVTWERWIGPTHTDYAIVVHNLDTGETRLIGAGDGNQQSNPDVSGDRVVYQDNSSGTWDIKMYDWNSASISSVSASATSETQPRIDGNVVVWKDVTNGYLWYRDFGTTLTPATRIVNAGDDAIEQDVDNGRIIWSNPSFSDLRVAMVQPPILTGQMSSFSAQPESVEIHGDRIVCALPVTSSRNVMLFEFRPRILSILAGTVNDEAQPAVFHDTYAWVEQGVSSADLIYSRPRYLVSTIGDTEEDQRPSMYGHRVVWDRDNGSDWDVMLATAATKLQSRTSGANRYATAAAASSAYFSTGPLVFAKLDNVVLCTGENFPDALSAVPLARALQAPLLLTRRDSLPSETLAEITRLAPSKIYIIGGTAAISPGVENQLKATYTTERIAGDDRYDTSARIATKYVSVVGAANVSRAFFARGDDFPDALALGPIAAGAQGPVMLVKTDAVPPQIAAAVDALNIKNGYIAGSTTAVSENTATSLGGIIAANGGAGTCLRFEGDNRYETAVSIIDSGITARWIDLDTLGVATGLNFPDALGGGAALGYYGSPVILTNGTSLSSAASSFLATHEYEIGHVNVFGGTNVVSSAVYDAVAAKIK